MAESIETATRSELALVRANMLALANTHFLELPNEAFCQRLLAPDYRNQMRALARNNDVIAPLREGASLITRYLDAHEEDDIEEFSLQLARDRTRLYRGASPSNVLPYPCEAVWSGAEGKDAALLVQRVVADYRACGFAPSPDLHERADYIGVELEFIRQLALREAECASQGDEETAQQLFDEQRDFFNQHLSWVPVFAHKAMDSARTDFYRGHLSLVLAIYEECATDFA